MATNLPPTDPVAQAHSDQLVTLIKQKIMTAGGKISFADYMHTCLYAPGLGYYSAGSHKIGARGDFTTAPEISSLFSYCLAQHIQDVFEQLEHRNILEFGAGSGKMAVDILQALEQKSSLPEHYYILEASADLRQRQERYMLNNLPNFFDRVIWLDEMPADFVGVVVANEVCDAMPVHCVQFKEGEVHERYIEVKNDQLHWCEGEIFNQSLAEHVAELRDIIGQNEMLTEVNLTSAAWIKSVAECLQQGAIFIIDYGYSQTEYYHPQRVEGTLMCYHQHQGHSNPLILQGLQDITAHVEFTLLAQTAFNAGLNVAGFQSHADFLLAGGISELIPDNANPQTHMDYVTEIKQLTLPSEMGESFKVLTLTKELESLLVRVQLADRRHSL